MLSKKQVGLLIKTLVTALGALAAVLLGVNDF